MQHYTSVDDYLSQTDPTRRELLRTLRQLIIEQVPTAIESIAYGMPAYYYDGQPLIYFAAMKSHLGIYPTPGPIVTLAADLEGYSTSKGCVRIPYNKPLPLEIIKSLIRARQEEIARSK